MGYGPSGTIGLHDNIETININTKLASIPLQVDILVGNPDNGLVGRANLEHVLYRNDDIFNLTNVNSPAHFRNTYFSCIAKTPAVRRGFLNLEIGDVELFLENNVLPYTAE